MASEYTKANYRGLSPFQRAFLRSEYRFLRKQGVDRVIARGCMYRCADHIHLAARFGPEL